MKPHEITGYTLNYALTHKFIFPKSLILPKGWRWLDLGERTRVGDVSCNPLMPPVKIISGGDTITISHHPIRRRETPKDYMGDAIEKLLNENCTHPHLAYMGGYPKSSCKKCLRT